MSLLTQQYQQGASGLLQQIKQEIDMARGKITEINDMLENTKSGSVMEDTLNAVSADEMRTYWNDRLHELQELLLHHERRGNGENPNVLAEFDYLQLQNLDDNTVRDYRLMPGMGGVRQERVISASSPLGKALIGRMPGDVVSVQTPRGTKKYKLLNFTKI